MRVVPIRLPLSNAHLVLDERPILVDVGGPKDAARIVAALAREDVQPSDLALIVLTHGHADHAGAARELHERSGAPIALHAADAHMAHAGHNDPLHPVGLEARLVLPFVNFPFPAFEPDVVVERELDLRPFGVAGTLVPWAGHTAGSVLVQLDAGEALVGDTLRGGAMGGALNSGYPNVNYYTDDLARERDAIRRLAELPVERFYVGHGGPLRRATVERHMARLAPPARKS